MNIEGTRSLDGTCQPSTVRYLPAHLAPPTACLQRHDVLYYLGCPGVLRMRARPALRSYPFSVLRSSRTLRAPGFGTQLCTQNSALCTLRVLRALGASAVAFTSE